MSYYFNNVYPTIDYDATVDGITTRIQDIFVRVIARKSVTERDVLFQKFRILDEETPESVSDSIYGSPKYYWIILLTNKIYDRYYEWPMSDRNLRRFVGDKYANPDAVHHYEISQSSGDTNTKITVELADQPTAYSVSNYEYEIELNDNRKDIRVLDPVHFPRFVNDYMELIKETIL